MIVVPWACLSFVTYSINIFRTSAAFSIFSALYLIKYTKTNCLVSSGAQSYFPDLRQVLLLFLCKCCPIGTSYPDTTRSCFLVRRIVIERLDNTCSISCQSGFTLLIFDTLILSFQHNSMRSLESSFPPACGLEGDLSQVHSSRKERSNPWGVLWTYLCADGSCEARRNADEQLTTSLSKWSLLSPPYLSRGVRQALGVISGG